MRGSLALLLVAAGCANRAPDSMLRSPEAMQHTATGSWVDVEARYAEVRGELIAVTPQVIVLDDQHRVHRIPRNDVVRALVQAYDPQQGGVGAWGLLGVLSTASHGWFLVISAPIWLLVGFGTSVGTVRETLFEYPDVPLDTLAVWARFPQGLPADVDAATLRRLPPPPPPPPLMPASQPAPTLPP